MLGAGRLLRTSWDETWHLMQRAVARGLAAKEATVPAHVGVDEKSAGRGQDYITVVSDLDRGTVEHIADERRQSSLDSYFEKLTTEQKTDIQAVAMDMWSPTPTRCGPTFPTRTTRSCSTASTSWATWARRSTPCASRRTVPCSPPATRASRGRSTCAVLRGEPPRTPPQALRHPATPRTSRPPGRNQGEPAELLGVPAARLGRASLQELVLLGDPLAPPTGDRGGAHAQAARGRTDRVLLPPHHQRRGGGPQLTHPGDPGVRPRVRNRENFKTAIFFHCGGLQLYPQTH